MGDCKHWAVLKGDKEMICQSCGKEGAERRRQRTAYVDDALNWATLCPECQDEAEEYWREQWNDYYNNCM